MITHDELKIAWLEDAPEMEFSRWLADGVNEAERTINDLNSTVYDMGLVLRYWLVEGRFLVLDYHNDSNYQKAVMALRNGSLPEELINLVLGKDAEAE